MFCAAEINRFTPSNAKQLSAFRSLFSYQPRDIRTIDTVDPGKKLPLFYDLESRLLGHKPCDRLIILLRFQTAGAINQVSAGPEEQCRLVQQFDLDGL